VRLGKEIEMCKVSKSKPMVLKVELERESMKELMDKLSLAGIDVPKAGLALKFSGKKATLSIGIHKDTYQKFLNLIVGYIMVGKVGYDLSKSIELGDLKIPQVDFNGIKVAGEK
jgi:hypothetical protein